MSSPLAAALASIYMGLYEVIRLNEYNLNKPKFYLRHIDGILPALKKEQSSLIFLKLFK